MRWKLIIGNALAVIVVGLVAWFLVRGSASESLGKPVDPAVNHGIESYRGLRALDREALMAVAARVSRRDDLRKVFDATTEKDQRARAEDFAAAFVKDPGAQGLADQMPDYVVVASGQGVVIGRNGDTALDHNRDLKKEFPLVEAVIAGVDEPMIDMIKYDKQKWFTAVAVPVRGNGNTPGIVILAYPLADTAAKRDANRLGLEVGYLVRDGAGFALPSVSLDDNNQKQELLRFANDGGNKLGALFDAGTSLGVRDVTIGGQTYRIAASPMPLISSTFQSPAGSRGGFVVFQNLTAAKEASGGIALPVLILSIVGFLVGFAVNFMISGEIMKTVGRVEDGLLRIINGDREHRMEIRHAELGGIVDRVNQLVSVLSGEDEGEQTDETGRISKPASRTVPQAVSPRKSE